MTTLSLRVKQAALLASALAAIAQAALGCSASSSGSSAPAGACLNMASIAACVAADGAASVRGIYGLSSLPTGACSNSARCQMLVDPCPDWGAYAGNETVDAYQCACVNGAWSCAICTQGMAMCVEAADGAASAPPMDAASE